MGYGNCCGYEYGPGFARRFTTKEERIAALKEYQSALEEEIQAVKERIEAVQKA